MVPADAGKRVTHAAHGAAFDATLTAPVNASSLARALAEHGFVAVSPDECAAVGAAARYPGRRRRRISSGIWWTAWSTPNRLGLAMMRAALTDGAWQRFDGGAHRIKSSARILECAALVTLCGRLEAVAQFGDLATAQALLPILAATVEHLEASLTAMRPPPQGGVRVWG
ncbi:Hpt domain-containing protein [Cupriavidus basilensis]